MTRAHKSRNRALFALSGGNLFSLGLGAFLMWLFDPDRGSSRRAILQDKLGATFRRASGRAQRRARYASGQVVGMKEKVSKVASGEKFPADDQTLLAKIQSEALGGSVVPKERINVNVQDGIAFLRGQLDTREQIDEIEQSVRKVEGVIDVRNLLHLPGETAPNIEPVIRAQREQRDRS